MIIHYVVYQDILNTLYHITLPCITLYIISNVAVTNTIYTFVVSIYKPCCRVDCTCFADMTSLGQTLNDIEPVGFDKDEKVQPQIEEMTGSMYTSESHHYHYAI